MRPNIGPIPVDELRANPYRPTRRAKFPSITTDDWKGIYLNRHSRPPPIVNHSPLAFCYKVLKTVDRFGGCGRQQTRKPNNMKMKQLMVIAAAAFFTATAAQAAHEYNWNARDRFTYASEGDVFLPNEFSFDAFATYTSTPRANFEDIFKNDLRHGTWGGGIGLNYFFTKYVGISTDVVASDNGYKFIDSASANLVLRLPIEPAHIAPYIFGGAGGQFDPKSQYLIDAGVGVDFRINHWTGIFIDARYVWPEDTADYGLFRSGLRFAF